MSPLKQAKIEALEAQAAMFNAQTRYYNAMTRKVYSHFDPPPLPLRNSINQLKVGNCENENIPPKKNYLSLNRMDAMDDINSLLDFD